MARHDIIPCRDTMAEIANHSLSDWSTPATSFYTKFLYMQYAVQGTLIGLPTLQITPPTLANDIEVLYPEYLLY
jgi:hypothetical protein